MMKLRLKKKGLFTLIEMVVSLGVFSVLMLIMFQLFTSAQKAWMTSKSRTDAYENAKIALDLISRDLQCVYYEQGKVPFYHYPGTTTGNDTEALFFVSATNVAPSDINSRLCEIAYKFYNLDDATASTKDGWLVRSVTGDNLGTKWNFYDNWNDPTPNIRITSYNDTSDATYAFTLDSTSSDAYNTVISNVVNLTFKCYKRDGTEITAAETFPYSVKMELSLLDLDSWKKWIALGGRTAAPGSNGDRFKNENLKTFSKTVFIGERGQQY